VGLTAGQAIRERGEVDLAVPEIEIEDLKENNDKLRRQLQEK